MRTPRTLLVYYSRTGTTRLVAESIAAALPCDVEEIEDTRNRRGIFGYFRAGFDAFFRRLTVLKPLHYDPAPYDLVIVGTPTWNTSLSAPVRTYLTLHKARMRHVAFFCTCRGVGAQRVLHQMAEACGMRPIDVLELREDEVRLGAHQPRVRDFVQSIASSQAAA
jgi:flavodoxin